MITIKKIEINKLGNNYNTLKIKWQYIMKFKNLYKIDEKLSFTNPCDNRNNATNQCKKCLYFFRIKKLQYF